MIENWIRVRYNGIEINDFNRKMTSRIIILSLAGALLSLPACSRDSEDGSSLSHDPERGSKAHSTDQSGFSSRPSRAARSDAEEELDEAMEAASDAEHAGSDDLLEDPAFKKVFEDLLKGYQFTDDQKKRLGELIHLLRAVDPEKFDSKERKARLGLSGEAADRLIDTSATGDVEGLIDSLLTEIEEIAFDPIDTPTGVSSDGGVILHIDEKGP